MTSKSQNTSSQGYILLVDDQPDNLRLLSTTLTEAGYRVKNAISAQVAFMGISAALPELILLDIMMPDINGYQFCQQLKDKDETKEIPVIFLSALNDELDKLRAFEFGGVDYITKPFHVKEVLARVKNQLTLVRQKQKITEQNLLLQQLNAQLMEVNKELIRSNKDLEQFAYIASHDLRSPLQTMKAFAQLLVQKYQDRLDTKADRYITRILEAGNRMDRLIQDLLDYSRVGNKAIELEPINCDSLLELVLANLQAAIESSSAIIIHDKLPTVMGKGTQLAQLFQNLIDNAIKFRRPDVPLQIKISVQQRQKISSLSALTVGGKVSESSNRSTQLVGEKVVIPQAEAEWLFAVSDNGIGIETQYFERIFQVFQRLFTIEEYPGTGMGLAICKKIIERHGGCIWVESSLDVGTTFYFSIPLR
ncbi:MAG TPA: hybrid sensor histidine kinase/response regulator [Cyanobacteria bacterium UBA8803]|nr:hybrid sensor histidine kinase/response regulator [Cyanobacteria bacterium UBA9273]HBL60642.1 hybrid sensor histidine kinase/response regulator [Cyanobacteria bacterium UBA8803]